VAKSYFSKADGILFIFDVTNRESFNNVVMWQGQVKAELGDNISTILVGNKSDLAHERQVNKDEGEALAKKIGCQYIETSAYNGDNVEAAFLAIATDLKRKRFNDSPIRDTMVINKRTTLQPKEPKDGCCKS
jgi:small GTP-binding protein